MFDALNGRKWPVLQRKTVIGLIIGDAVPKLLQRSPSLGAQASVTNRLFTIFRESEATIRTTLTIDKSHHQPNHPAESTAPDHQPTQMFVDHLLNNVLYHFGVISSRRRSIKSATV